MTGGTGFQWGAPLRIAGAALVGAWSLLLAASLLPLRLEARNFQDLARTKDLPVPRGLGVLFVSEARSSSAYRFFTFVAPQLAYPSTSVDWLILLEQAGGDARNLAAAADGRLVHLSPGQPPGAVAGGESALRRYLSDGVILYEDQGSREAMERRLPILRGAVRPFVLRAPAAAGNARRSLRSVATVTRLMRLTALLALLLTVHRLARTWLVGTSSAGEALACAALAVWLVPAIAIWSLSWSQVVPMRAPGAWPFVLAGTGLLGVALAPPTALSCRMSTRTAGIAAALLAVQVAQFIVRLDFDGDTLSHWQLMARGLVAEGRHVPAHLLGHIHSATYPFGFAEILALSAWVADAGPGQAFELNEATGLALLVYRVSMAIFQTSTLALVTAAVWRLREQPWLGVSSAAVTAALFPVTIGRPMAAESLLFPFLVGTIVLLALVRNRDEVGPAVVACFVAGVATLVKLEGTVLAGLFVVPWLPLRRRLLVPLAGAVLVGALPTLVWRLSLDVANPVYLSPSVEHLRQALPRLPDVLLRCAMVTLRENLVPLFAGVLPVFAALRIWKRRRGWWDAVAVPFSVLGGWLILSSIYLFTTVPWAEQIDTSFSRLLMVPAFSAVVFCFETVAVLSDPPTRVIT